MQSKKRLTVCFMVMVAMLSAVPVSAEEKDAKLPVIASWQDGHGYRDDGTQILNGWAYDSVNPAGKYVLFGTDGSVLRKSENQEMTDPSEDYSGTELVPAVLALRAEIFEGFHGTVTVYLEEKSGVQKSVELNAENFFGRNICVNSGDYVLQKVEARDGEDTYVAEFSKLVVHLQEKETRVMKIRVTETKEEIPGNTETEETQAEETQMEETQNEQPLRQTENKEGKEEDMMRDMGTKKVMALFGGIGAACLAGILLLRKKRKNYD